MRKLVLAAGVVGGMLAMGADAVACGDKLVVVGRGLRARRVKGTSASILVWAQPRGAVSAAIGQGQLRTELERAGHRVRSVVSRQELENALQVGTYDLVLADLDAMAVAATKADGAASKPTVLPTLYNPSEAELNAATNAYRCVLKSPGNRKDYLSVVDEAMTLRSKQKSAR